MIPRKLYQYITVLTLVLSLLAGCQSGPVSPALTSVVVSTAPVATPVSTAVDRPGNLSDEKFATLSSLEMVDDYPLYTMRYYGSYRTATAAEFEPGTGLSGEDILQLPPNWACSLYAALGDSANSAYGRNFDWEFSPALLLFTDPPDGYASVSMVNLAFIHNWGSEVQQLTDQPLERREALLRAPFLPIDGMNECGLVIGMAAVPHRPSLYDPDKDMIGSLGIIRQVLDHARDVENAVDILRSYNIDWGEGPPIHYLVADRTGRAALVEFYENEMVVFPNELPWYQATNFLQAAAGESLEGNCWRYDKIKERLNETGGRLTPPQALELLAGVSQAGTQWSVVYGIHSGDITVAMGRDYQAPQTFKLDLAGE